MCGIAGYIGRKGAYPILINMLHSLEYRGYDSAGVALVSGQKINAYKAKGKVSDLEAYVAEKDVSGTIGIAHTRWATHGEPNQVNAHPHFSQSQSLVIVHNGIIENYEALKQLLQKEGYTFKSETDTEVVIQFIEYIRKTHSVDLKKSLQIALSQVVGAFAICVMDRSNPKSLFVARRGSPLIIGIGESEFFVSSDATALVSYTDKVIYLKDNEVAVINLDTGVDIATMSDGRVLPEVKTLEYSLTQLQKGNYPYYMLKEIYEQPQSLFASLQGRVNVEGTGIALSGVIDNKEIFLRARRVVIVACGSSWHAGLIAKYALEEFARIPVEVEYSSEFRYRKPVIASDDIIIAISQSGETADTLAAIQLAKEAGAFVFSISNVVGSSIPRLSHSGCYTHVGPEIGVAATKTFSAQVLTLILLALCVAKEKRTIAEEQYHTILQEMIALPKKVETVLAQNECIAQIARSFSDVQSCLYLGRGYNYPISLEGALKMKEISYIHAEGYAAAEMKHGPIALISQEMPVIVIAPTCGHYEKMVNNVHEVITRKGRVISIVSEDDVQIRSHSQYSIVVPKIIECLSPILTVIPLQLLAYHVAINKNLNVDQPRNLAKSVTVE